MDTDIVDLDMTQTEKVGRAFRKYSTVDMGREVWEV